MAPTKCIYCGEPLEPHQGEGDHVVPARLGRFKGGHRFRRICVDCNAKFSPGEEQLTRCAPEALFLRKVNPSRNRRGEAGRWLGAGGLPPPRMVIPHVDHEEHVQLGPEGNLIVKDAHLAVVDATGGQFKVPLFRSLGVEALRQKLLQTTPHKITRAHLHCTEEDWTFYVELLEALWPGRKVVERAGRAIGHHLVPVEMTFQFNIDYWRAIAKIGFHYFLCANDSGYDGSERLFARLKDFLLGGRKNKDDFFTRRSMFGRGTGPQPDGTVLTTSVWHHWLAFCIVDGEIFAGVQLFMGPEHAAPIHTILLGAFRSRLLVPTAVGAHVYEYTPAAGGGFDGTVRSTGLLQV